MKRQLVPSPTGASPASKAPASKAKRNLQFNQEPVVSSLEVKQSLTDLNTVLTEPVNADILWSGDMYSYTIPSFSVLTVSLRHIEVCVGTNKFDCFIQPSDEVRNFPLSILATEYCYVEATEFVKSIDIQELRLSKNGVMIIWKWENLSDSAAESTVASDNENREEEDYFNREEEDFFESSGPEEDCEQSPTHSIVFKVIGCTKEQNYQTVLKQARNLFLAGVKVPVKVQHEPDNPYNRKAIAFLCELDGKWHRIGYVVNEIVNEVHSAFNDILKVEFEWISFVTEFTRSGPGFFCGVNITRKGKWSTAVVKARSTR